MVFHQEPQRLRPGGEEFGETLEKLFHLPDAGEGQADLWGLPSSEPTRDHGFHQPVDHGGEELGGVEGFGAGHEWCLASMTDYVNKIHQDRPARRRPETGRGLGTPNCYV
jgi:hypothetical protein